MGNIRQPWEVSSFHWLRDSYCWYSWYSGKEVKISVSAWVSCLHHCWSELGPMNIWLLQSQRTQAWVTIESVPLQEKARCTEGGCSVVFLIQCENPIMYWKGMTKKESNHDCWIHFLIWKKYCANALLPRLFSWQQHDVETKLTIVGQH